MYVYICVIATHISRFPKILQKLFDSTVHIHIAVSALYSHIYGPQLICFIYYTVTTGYKLF